MKYLVALVSLSAGIIGGSILLSSSSTTGDETSSQCPVVKAVAGSCCGGGAVSEVADKTDAQDSACCAGKECHKGESCPASASQGEAGVPAQLTALEGEAKSKKGPKIECPVMGGEAKKEVSTEYCGGKVFFCCPDCIEEFKKHQDKYVAKANQQLVLAKQYVQKACPLTGRPVSADQKAEIGGVVVHFCCQGCAGKIEKMADAECFNAVFGNAGFEKGFEPRKKEEKKQG